MALSNPNVAARFIAEVAPVKEISLLVAADLAFWQVRLQNTGVFPFAHAGEAQLVVSATDFRSMGRPTNELTIALVVCERPTGDTPDAMFLVHAFNGSRTFAWIERTFFATPYHHGSIQFDGEVPVGMGVADRAGPIMQARMGRSRPVVFTRDETWQGKIYLPHRRASGSPSSYFVAKLAGDIATYAYEPEHDVFDCAARSDLPFTEWLRASWVRGLEWRVRRNGVHARSRTFRTP